MIVAATFVASGIVAWAHYEMIGRLVLPGVTVWVTWYAAVLIALCSLSIRVRDRATIAASIVLAMSFLFAHFTWGWSSTPVAAQSLRCIAVGALLFVVAVAFDSRAVAIAGAVHLIVVIPGAAADLGFLSTGAGRPATFLAWSFPDISAGLQHAALLVIGLGTRNVETASVGNNPGYGDPDSVVGLARMEVPHREV